MPQLDRSNVAPFVSLLLARTGATSSDKKHVAEVLSDVKAVVESIDDDVRRTLQGVGQPGTHDELTSGFLHYEERRRPTWSREDPPDLFDYINHVIVVSQKAQFVAVCSSSKQFQEEIGRAIRNRTIGLKPVGDLSLLDSGLLNAALVGRRARTLWLAGLHRRTSVKADNKIVSGVSLVDALSPLGDQTYMFSAVRSELPSSSGITGTIGVTPRKASLWTRPSKSWDDFQSAVSLILDHIATSAAAGATTTEPLPILATPAGFGDPIQGAYDMSVIPPELQLDDPIRTPDPVLARLAYDIQFEVKPLKGASFHAKILQHGGDIGSLEIEVEVGKNGEAVHTVAVIGTSNKVVEEIRKACSHLEWLTVYYESGHTLVGAQVYRPQFRDVHYRGWSWRDFTNYRIDREKPLDGKAVAFDRIGLEKSLFCWTIKNWPVPTNGAKCWLACDDGANEVADFIALTTGGSATPLLSLIHVKGSHSRQPNRDLSTSAFEIVVNQAVKNLRSLERRNLSEILQKGSTNSTKKFAWTNGKRADDRTAMLKALEALQADYEREVVIIQPSARRQAYTRSLGPQASSVPKWYYRRAQLDTLLLGAESVCFDFGARLRIIAEDA